MTLLTIDELPISMSKLKKNWLWFAVDLLTPFYTPIAPVRRAASASAWEKVMEQGD